MDSGRGRESTMSTIVHEGTGPVATPANVSVSGAGITAGDVGILVLRLALGAVFFAHGAQKVLGWFGGQGLEATVAGFVKSGVPLPLAYLVPFTEFLGGLGLIFGVLARLSALGIAVIMLVAIFKVHLPNGFFMNWFGNQKGEGFEYHLLVIGMALMVILAGPGRLALADLEGKLFKEARVP